MSDSVACARAVIGQLVAQGVTELVLAPGSRSAPLALVAEAAARQGSLRLHVRVDERSAGFLALGLAKATRRCVPVVTTSGTAVGNLLPAVMEAHHSAIPLLVISADRPAALVGTEANQTTTQTELFADFVRYRARLSSAAPPASWSAQTARATLAASGEFGAGAGPAQLNLELAPPLVPAVDQALEPVESRQVRTGGAPESVPLVLPGLPRTLVICGDADPDTGRAAVELAEAARLPLLAEPSSNARVGANALRYGRVLAAGALAAQVERVIVFGRPNLSRPVVSLLSRPEVEVVVISQTSRYPDPGWQAAAVAGAVLVEPGDVKWLQQWQRADAAAQVGSTRPRFGLAGASLAELVLASVPSDQVLCLGNSNPIRDADLAPVGSEAGPVYANRGLSGIDGGIATAVGVALGSGAPTTLLLGDLAFYHDLNSLLIPPGEPRPRLRVVVADDAGGSIFATLEYGQPRFAASFERVFNTPTGLDLVALATAFGLPARRLRTADEVASALAEAPSSIEVLVVEVSREGRTPPSS